MIKVSVLYPSGDGANFDIGYYEKSHIPMVIKLLGSALKKVDVDHGLAGGLPGLPPPYIAMAHMYFESIDAFKNAFGPHQVQIGSDMSNFTNVQPVIQISNVLCGGPGG